MSKLHPSACALLVLWIAVTPALGRSSQTPNCRAPEYRQFDFWVGNWEVRNSKGDLVGTNLVTSEQDGCALMEHWKSKVETGVSLNAYDAGSKQWSQTWVDSSGSVLHLSGHGEMGTMSMQSAKAPSGLHSSIERITWTLLNDGRVRQLWDYSKDAGKTWKIRFDGYYSKKK